VTPLGLGSSPTSDGSPSHHILSSSPSSLLSLGDLRRRPMFETRVLPRYATMDVAEAELTLALVAIVGRGPRPTVSGS
jgi:hypothetical protein